MTAADINPVESYNSNGEEYEIPGAEELENLYMMLEKGGIPELQWQFPGRQQINIETVAPKVEPTTSANIEEE